MTIPSTINWVTLTNYHTTPTSVANEKAYYTEGKELQDMSDAMITEGRELQEVGKELQEVGQEKSCIRYVGYYHLIGICMVQGNTNKTKKNDSRQNLV